MLTADENQRFSFKVGQHTKHELLLENRIITNKKRHKIP